MYAGKVVELAPTEELFGNPRHPYTQALLTAVPSVDPDVKMNIEIGGEVADAGRLPPGCSFHPRCPKRFGPCDKVVPVLREQAATGCSVSCHLYEPGAAAD